MKNLCKPLLVVVLILPAGCGKKERHGAWVGEDPKVVVTESPRPKPPPSTRVSQGAAPDKIKQVVPPEVKLPPLATLNITLPAGWTKRFLENSNEWNIDKDERKAIGMGDLMSLTRITVKRSPVEIEPKTLDQYIAFLAKKPDEGGFIWPQLIESGNLADGFYIVARVRLATDVTNTNITDTGFCVVRTIGGDRIRFKCHNVKDAGVQAEGLELCKTARF